MAVFLPLAALMIVLSEPVCFLLADATIAHSERVPSEHDALVETALAVRDYSLGNDEAALPVGSDYRFFITADALEHLRDVRVVFIACIVACVVLLAALVALMIIAVKRRGASVLGWPLLIGGAAPLVAAAALGIAIAVDFSAFFVWMHGILFAEGTWTFPYDSLLIRALPYGFWVGCAIVWAASMVALCIVSVALGAVLLYKKKKQTKLAALSLGEVSS